MRSLWFMMILSLVVTGNMFAQERKLSLAVFPYVSPSKILVHQKGLKHFLEKELNRPISIITAKSSQNYLENVKKGDYDIIYTAPHMGRYSELKLSYQRIAMTKNNIQGLYIVKKESPMKSLADAKEKTIAMASPVTILHQITLQDLEKLNLKDGKNIKIRVTKNHMNALFSLLKGSSDLALTGVKLWKKLSPKYKDQLRLLSKSTKTTGFLVMGNPASINEKLRAQLETAFLKFNQSEAGTKYIFKGFKAIDEKGMKSLDKYIYVLD